MAPVGDDYDTDEEVLLQCADCGGAVEPPRHVWLCGGCLGTAQESGLIIAVRRFHSEQVAGMGYADQQCAMCHRTAADLDELLSCLPRNLCDRCYRLPWDRGRS